MSKTHITVDGDTFDALALMYYDDEKLAWEIIAANPDFSDVLIFDEGIALTIPDVSTVTVPETLPPWRRGA